MPFINFFFLGLAFIILLAFLDFLIGRLPTKRNKELEEIINDLKSLDPRPEEKWAVRENIIFFKASRTVFSYLLWLIKEVPRLRKNRERLFELADFSLPKWQEETHRRFVALEKMAFPGLLKPIKKEILKFILSAESREPLTLLNLGSGAMELERQVIEEVLKRNEKKPLIFLAVDLSPHISKIGLLNLDSFSGKEVVIKNLFDLNERSLEALKGEALKSGKIIIAVVNNDALNLETLLKPKTIDLIYGARFLHHLPAGKQKQISDSAISLSKKVVFFDDFCAVPVFIFPSILTWKWPVTLNGAILSYIRDFSKKELLEQAKANQRWKLYFMEQLGYYLKTYE